MKTILGLVALVLVGCGGAVEPPDVDAGELGQAGAGAAMVAEEAENCRYWAILCQGNDADAPDCGGRRGYEYLHCCDGVCEVKFVPID